jgi:uncharacterized protein
LGKHTGGFLVNNRKDGHKENELKLSFDTKILDLIKEYPFLVDALTELSPRYEKLKNPILRKTVGKVANLRMVAIMGSVPIADLMNVIKESVSRNAGIEVSTEDFEGPHDDRIDILKGIILSLHTGEEVEEAKKRFEDTFKDVAYSEIAQMEQQLIAEGLPITEVKNLCDVHMSLFKDSLESDRPEMKAGHPIHTYLAENSAINETIEEIKALLEETEGKPDPASHPEIWEDIAKYVESLAEVEKHYLRKEYQLFPILEKNDFTGPSQVMWAIHDDIRALFKEVSGYLEKGNSEKLPESIEKLMFDIFEMTVKEEAILIPTAMEMLTHEDWATIHKSEEEVGFALVERGTDWNPRIKINLPQGDAPATPPFDIPKVKEPEVARIGEDELIDLDIGQLTKKQINQILLHVPVELSFTDHEDRVRYYTGVEHKLFPRMPGVIGREVRHCHPPKSLHMVEQILNDFKSGKEDTANFWMEDFQGKFVLIRYDAVRDEDGKYIGCLETVQDVTKIRKLDGNQRLLDYQK